MKKYRNLLYRVIFGTDTPAGKMFDVVLLLMIMLSVLTVVLESVKRFHDQSPDLFISTEWFFTIIFSVEYMLRIYSHPKPIKYITSFMGIIDLLAILPTYLGLFFDQTTFLLTVRVFRLLRMFRILKLTRYVFEANLLMNAMKQSLHKITVFFGVVLTLVLILGTLMYMVESESSGFHSIPQGIYWAIVTITTVGYGDIAPATTVGKLIASIAMLTGYSIIAVPTGIITVELGKVSRLGKTKEKTRTCKKCGHEDPDDEARFCSRCGEPLQ